MAAGHSPFDINPREKQTQMGRSVPYEILIGIVIVLVVGFALYTLYQYERGRIVAGPLVQAREDGTLLVAWRTGGTYKTELVLNMADSPGESEAQAQVIGPVITENHFVAVLPDMLLNHPFSTYILRTNLLIFYRSAGSWTITQPRVMAPFRFVVFGGSGGAARPRTMVTAILQSQPHLVLHIGDLIQEGGEAGADYDSLYARQFLDPYSILINIMPFMPVISGHEKSIGAGEPFRRFFVLPQNGPPGLVPELCYWFDYGTARFAAIDSNQSGEAMEQKIVPWLQKVFVGAPTSWKFVFLQHSPYTGGLQHPPDEKVQKILVPAFEAVGVDGVFSAGNCLYERTHPMRKGEVAPLGQGIVYITTGAGGRGLHGEQRPAPGYVAAFEDRVYSFSFIELIDGRLHLQQVGENGQLIDDWWFTRPGHSPATSESGVR